LSDAKRLRALTRENRRLKKRFAEEVMDNAILKKMLIESLLTPSARKSVVSWAIETRDYSRRRACTARAAVTMERFVRVFVCWRLRARRTMPTTNNVSL
jgi:hypothetical protein